MGNRRSRFITTFCACLLAVCASVANSESSGPSLGSLFNDEQLEIQLVRVHQLYNANNTCELFIKFINNSQVELEPQFRMLLLDQVGDTVGQEKMAFPIVLAGKSFSGVKYIYEIGCSRIASVRLTRVK